MLTPDANNILAVGADLGHPVPMPTIELAKKHMQRAEELGGQDQDWSSLSAAVREEAKLPPYRKGKCSEARVGVERGLTGREEVKGSRL